MVLVAKAEYNYNYYPETIDNPKPKQTVKRKKKVRTINKTMYISIAIIFLITSLFILFGYARITSTRLEITKMEKEKLELEKIKQDLIGELEGLKNTTKISQEATYNLGMIYPEEGQIVYVSVDDTTELAVESPGLSQQLRRFLSIFSSLF